MSKEEMGKFIDEQLLKVKEERLRMSSSHLYHDEDALIDSELRDYAIFALQPSLDQYFPHYWSKTYRENAKNISYERRLILAMSSLLAEMERIQRSGDRSYFVEPVTVNVPRDTTDLGDIRVVNYGSGENLKWDGPDAQIKVDDPTPQIKDVNPNWTGTNPTVTENKEVMRGESEPNWWDIIKKASDKQGYTFRMGDVNEPEKSEDFTLSGKAIDPIGTVKQSERKIKIKTGKGIWEVMNEQHSFDGERLKQRLENLIKDQETLNKKSNGESEETKPTE
jgi:hypothetical protein